MCHENSTIDGKHGDLNHPFIDTLKPGMEIAIGGGNPIEHPDLIPFLNKLKNKNIIANMTLRDTDVIKYSNLVKKLLKDKLIIALGISLSNVNTTLECINMLNNDNIVVHLINGIVTSNDIKLLSDKGIKILLLGYKKNTGRGKAYYIQNKLIDLNIDKLASNLKQIIPKFKVVSFDNLSIEQLKVKDILSEKEWKSFYMGEEGHHSMYIDLVKEEFAMNSTSNIRYDLKNNLIDMFNVIKKEV